MRQTFEAIYENGVITPLEPLGLPDRQRLEVTIRVQTLETPDETLQAWQEVYKDFTETEIAEIERQALGRQNFMRPSQPR
ncbi:MAG: antitoxin family protein [Chloroflexota bacterium]